MSPADVVLDAGPLIGIERRDQRTMAWIKEARQRGSGLWVAGATFTEVWRGHRHGRGTQMSIALNSAVAVPTTKTIGKRAGELLEEAGADEDLRFDAIVVATAADKGADVLTEDLEDIELLGSYAGVTVLSV